MPKQMIKNAEKCVAHVFEQIDEIRDFNQEKVLRAFVDNKVAPEHFYTVSGYGHDDLGREILDKTFAQVFKAEKALVRIHFASGTHTLACALFGNLRAGDKLISVAGAPYDTMQEVIGTAGDEETKRASLIGNGVLYDEVPLLNGSDIDFDTLKKMVDETTTMVLIQRSKGYSTRKSDWGLDDKFFEKYNVHKTYTHITTSAEKINSVYAEAFGNDVSKVHALGVARTDIFFDEEFLRSQKSKLINRYPELENKKIIQLDMGLL